MGNINGTIANAARSELPETWDKLAGSAGFGPDQLQRRVNLVMTELFSAHLTEDEQKILDDEVIDYAAKLVALKLIGPGIDFWSKQPVSLSASGRNEQKGWADRAKALSDLRKDLIIETRQIWPQVRKLLTNFRIPTDTSVPQVQQAGTAVAHLTSNPYDFDPAFGPKQV